MLNQTKTISLYSLKTAGKLLILPPGSLEFCFIFYFPFQFYWERIAIQYCISLRYTTQWLELTHHEMMTTINLLNIYHHIIYMRSYHVHPAVFKMDDQQRPTVQHRELCSILHSWNMKRIWKRIATCICITESLCCIHETNIILLIKYSTK